MDGSGFARQTVYSHLRHLIAAGIVSREAVRHGRGRPTILPPIQALDRGSRAARRRDLDVPEVEARVSLREGWMVQEDQKQLHNREVPLNNQIKSILV